MESLLCGVVKAKAPHDDTDAIIAIIIFLYIVSGVLKNNAKLVISREIYKVHPTKKVLINLHDTNGLEAVNTLNFKALIDRME